MAPHKLNIASEKLLVNNVPVGEIVTDAPSGIISSTETSTEGDGVAIRIRWEVERNPRQVPPLELLSLRLGEFFPEAMFIGGRRYEMSGVTPGQGRTLGFPYDTYYKFRIEATFPYDAALYSKMPLICWQGKDRAFAIVFPKELILPYGRLPLFIKASGSGTAVSFSSVILQGFEIARKSFGWFGIGSRRRRFDIPPLEGHILEASFHLIGADTWVECVQAGERLFYENRKSMAEYAPESITTMLNDALRYYNRVWDGRNRTHVHLPNKNISRFESVEFKHSHVTDDLAKLVLYRRLMRMGIPHVGNRERELSTTLASKAYCYEADGSDLWHTTTYYTGTGLKAFSHHGTGLVGFPGGMATCVRRLFEYCSRGGDTSFAELARSGADWLIAGQSEDGGWPALVSGNSGDADKGCVGSTAEAVRALIAAYSQTEEERYRAAAKRGVSFIERKESFFECRQYLRDIDPAETDGISAEACIHAHLDRYALAHEHSALDEAEKWGYYALQWIRPQSTECLASPSFDGLARSITPRIDVWGNLLIARAFLRLSRATGKSIWREHAYWLFENTRNLQERDGGFCETWFLDFPAGLESIHIEPTFVTDAFVEFLLDLCENEKENSGAGHGREFSESTSRRQAAFEPSSEAGIAIAVSPDRPELLIDKGLRLRLVFEGAYDWHSKMIQAAYAFMRRLAPGRWILKVVPIMKILLNRHFVRAWQSRIQGASRIKVIDFSRDDSGEGPQIHRYRTPVHEITLFPVSSGLDKDRFPTTDLEIGVKTTAGDVRVNQARIDLDGVDEVLSICGKEKIHLRCGQNEYSLEMLDDAVDGIIFDGGRLAMDITLSANWSFFGDYSLRLRVTRHVGKEESAET